MQKKLIALAVAGLVSGAAFAQTNVTIYGTVDMGYKNLSNNKVNGVSSRGGIDSGIVSANRIGFRGTEDLGNGLSANFVYETGLHGEEADGLTMGRQTYLNLSSKTMGTLQAGRQYTPQHLFTAATDPFAKAGIGSASNVLLQDARLDNSVAYVSPKFGGFTFIGAYSASYLADETDENESNAAAAAAAWLAVGGNTAANTTALENGLLNDADVWALAANYANGPIFLGANYHKASTNQAAAILDGVDVKVWDFMGSYDLGMVKLSGYYGTRNVDDVADTKQWMLGLSAPLGNGSLLASYNRRNTDFDNTGLRAGTRDAKVSQWAVGYHYNLSKRTIAYAQYSSQSQNDVAEAEHQAGAGLLAYGAAVGDNQNSGMGYQKGLAIGVRHSF